MAELPREMWADQYYAALPEVMIIANRVLVVKQRVKDLLEQFRLGETQFSEVEIWDDGPGFSNQFPGTWHILNIAEKRSAFVPEATEHARQAGGGGRWSWIGGEKYDLAVTASAPDDVDLWLDPNLADVFFLSAPLAEAIKAAKVPRFRTFPCRAVG